MTTQHSIQEWQKATLQQCCFRPEYGYTASASEKPLGPKFLRITDIQDGRVDWDKVPYVERPDEDGRSYFLEGGDIVIARIGATTGKAYLIQECPEAVFASYLIRVRAKPGLLPKFLIYCLQTSQYWQHINSQKGGRLKGGVNIPILENLEISLPIPIEQAAVVRALDAVLKVREVRQHELSLERERKAALMEQLFVHGTSGEPTRQTEIGEIPESWHLRTLSDVCAVKTSFPLFRDLEEKARCSRGGEKALALKVSDMNLPANKKYLVKSNFELKLTSHELLAAKALLPKSVVFPKRGAAIATNKKRLTVYPSFLDPNLIGVEPCQDIEPEFLYQFFERMDLRSLQDNTPIPQLNKNDVERVLLPLPALDEQRIIAAVSKAVDDKIACLEREENLLNELFRSMLEELMTGRLSALPLIEEPTLR